MAHRPLSVAMLQEVRPGRLPFDPIGAAHVVVWFRVAEMRGIPREADVVRRYGLQPVADGPLARKTYSLLRSSSGTFGSKFSKTFNSTLSVSRSIMFSW